MKMKFIDYFKENVVKISIAGVVSAIVVVCAISIISETYAFTPYTIIFNRAENTEVMKTCQTDENGKLDEDCLVTIDTICERWSPYPNYNPEGQLDQVWASDFANMTFTQDTNYYCVGGTSGEFNMGCYVCNNDNNIMHWAANGNANEFCEAGYTKSETILEEENCKVIVPDSCFVCNNDSNIMKWDNNGNADSECSSGYTSTSKPQNECVTIIPDSCFVCIDDNQIMKWDNNGNADSECSSGYTKYDNITDGANCKIENPKTGNILISLVWFIGMFAFGYILYYCKNLKD